MEFVDNMPSNQMESLLDIKVKYLPNAHILKQTNLGDWIDLYVYKDTTLKKFERKYINLGIALELPKGYEAIIAPRSSTYKNWGIIQTNSIGIVDNSYCGDNDIWMFPALAFKDVTIPAGTRICQFRILKSQPKLNFISVDSLGNNTRGGLGSTGL